MKTLKITGVLVFALAVVGCASMNNSRYNNPPGEITMSVYPEVYDSPPRRVELTITNNSDQTAQYGANYTIEKYTDGQWSEFERPEFAVIAIMYILQPGRSEVYQLELFPDQVDYTPGLYRIVKGIYLDITGEGYYTAGFEIK